MTRLLLLLGRSWRRGGCEAPRHLCLPRLEAEACSSSTGFFFILVSTWLHGGGSGSCCGSSSRVWFMFKGASLRRPATACSISPSGPHGCRAPAPATSICCADVSLAAPPHVALFTMLVWWLVHGDFVEILLESSRT
jgi:hypothetical protein